MTGIVARCWGMTCFLAVVALLSCGEISESGATTPQEFVEKYSRAYRNGDVNAIVQMTVRNRDQTEDDFSEEVKKDIDTRGLGYVAWVNTRYVSHEERGDYIHVDVEVQYARSSIVLVRRNGLLQVVQNPSEYEQNAR